MNEALVRATKRPLSVSKNALFRQVVNLSQFIHHFDIILSKGRNRRPSKSHRRQETMDKKLGDLETLATAVNFCR